METEHPEKALAVFEGKRIRRVWYKDEWYFSVVDVVAALTDSEDARNYWKVLKHRLKQESSGVVTKCNQLKLLASDGKYYNTDAANTEALFRIVQSIPSKKAEPFKLWLAKIGYERVQEIEDPELAQKRMKELYRKKGYSDQWIEKRIRGIAIRDELTDEWKNRGAKSRKDYSILTAEISQAAFGMNPDEYKRFKSLEQHNLRDHMDDMELILTMLGEAATTRFTRDRDSLNIPELKEDAKDGGDIAGDTRKNIENKLGRSVLSKENYLEEPEAVKRKKLKFSRKALKDPNTTQQ
ncbi:phage antirepressor protein [Candidatus Woesearchaeota archaeon]|nr:phage antirepressor protein [Candidatus Woesearchaeota archaeon]